MTKPLYVVSVWSLMAAVMVKSSDEAVVIVFNVCHEPVVGYCRVPL